LEPELAFWSKFAGAKAAQYFIFVSLSLNTIESLFDHVKYGLWSGEATPGVSRPVIIRVRTAYSISAT